MTGKFKTAIPAATLLLAVVFPCLPAHAQAASTLETDLKAKYKSDLVLVVQKEGIVGEAPNNVVPPCPATWKDNSLHAANGMCTIMEKNYSKNLANGDKVHPTGVTVKLKDEKVQVNFTECDSCNGGDVSSYKGSVVFVFPKGYLEGADAGQVQDVISQVLAPDSGDANAQGGGQQGAQQAQGNDQQQQQQAPQQPAAPAAPPASIQLGQTIDQVQSAFGPPEKIVNLGTKQIYVYKDLKVTFVNGKVTDVQ